MLGRVAFSAETARRTKRTVPLCCGFVSAADKLSMTSLHPSCIHGNVECLSVTLQGGAAPSRREGGADRCSFFSFTSLIKRILSAGYYLDPR
ncbi:hypothetical protein SKAU_G00177970 [Synaphobranchus kaupii]|uniref:Uncharacterized protein n=1 Tax=Synaphobranchus kaupii TaxID=118154 RepID=A0A9Q1FM82_SYNKA|nr:hypothetical protein SKAU_G00177970 [Synaphobranchus kaupii]